MSLLGQAEWDRLAGVATVVGWTPLASAYTVGAEVALGRTWAAVGKLAVTAVALGLVLWWWARRLESAMVGTAASARTRGQARGSASAQLLPRWLPWLRAGMSGALVAQQLRYWWRDARRRSTLIMVAIVSLFLPVLVSGGVPGFGAGGAGWEGPMSGAGAAGLATVYLASLVTSVFAASPLANQFGYDGTAYGTQLAVGVAGRRELRARAAAYSVLAVPLLVMVGVVMAAGHRSPALAPAVWGVLAAGYGAGLGVNALLSVFVPYPMPETGNPFATGSGDAAAKSLLGMLGLAGAGVATAPVLAAAVLLGDAWPWLAVPVGAGVGTGLAAAGIRLAADRLDRRGPELLAAVTPRR